MEERISNLYGYGLGAVVDIELAKIVVLYRQSDTMALWGIPYPMREFQSPRHLREADEQTFREAVARPLGVYGRKPTNYMGAWMWLGQPGWWGSMTPERIEKVKAFIAKHKDEIPTGPEEWSTIDP